MTVLWSTAWRRLAGLAEKQRKRFLHCKISKKTASSTTMIPLTAQVLIVWTKYQEAASSSKKKTSLGLLEREAQFGWAFFCRRLSIVENPTLASKHQTGSHSLAVVVLIRCMRAKFMYSCYLVCFMFIYTVKDDIDDDAVRVQLLQLCGDLKYEERCVL